MNLSSNVKVCYRQRAYFDVTCGRLDLVKSKGAEKISLEDIVEEITPKGRGTSQKA